MDSIYKIKLLIQKDVLAEFRNLSFLLALILFTVCIVFIGVRTLGEVDTKVFASILSIMMLFSTINVAAKSFTSEGGRQRIFDYSLYNPDHVIIAKILYNMVLNLIVFGLISILLVIIGGIGYPLLFSYVICGILSSLGLSIIFSFTSLISANEEAQGFSVLMSVLSMPLSIPIVLTMRKISLGCMQGKFEGLKTDFLILSGINLFLLGFVIMIFKELWSE
jgi:heme exporter protein B